MIDAPTLYDALNQLNLLDRKPPMWWPGYGTFDVVIGAVLTQNAQWARVEQSLRKLRDAEADRPEAIILLEPENLQELIRPSGLFNAKARTLQGICNNLLIDFGDFDAFTINVTREWLLRQKGIGPESADAILCYACERDAMVVDAYTARLLRAFDYEFDTYDELQAWCVEGMAGVFDAEELPAVYARFHGMIVEYVKRYKKGREVVVGMLQHL